VPSPAHDDEVSRLMGLPPARLPGHDIKTASGRARWGLMMRQADKTPSMRGTRISPVGVSQSFADIRPADRAM
jgi:hypothetical protein